MTSQCASTVLTPACVHGWPVHGRPVNNYHQGSEVYEHLEDWRRDRTDLPVSYDHLFENRAVIGTPEQCFAQILEIKDAGIEFFGGNFAFGGMENRKVRRSMELFAEKVMPHLG